MKPLYYAMVEGGFAFASEIKALLTHRACPSNVRFKEIAQFFTYGQLLGEDTMFESIRLVAASAVMSYDTRLGVLGCRRYWQLTPKALHSRCGRKRLPV